MRQQDLSGTTIGNYRIESLLGSGGMGQVYRAVHVLLNRPAALKVMHGHLADDPGFKARFVQEAQAAADLDHPNIIQVYEFGEHGGQFYLVMELIADGSLRGLMRGQGSAGQHWSLDLGLDLVGQAADGLNYAHSKGMVHRDIKPDNLLVKRASTAEASYAVKITDFGLARLAEGGMRTMSGVTMGTPAYMSPEQFQDRNLDGRSDIYSLGVVLYEVATGYLPFEARTLSDAVYKHVYSEPPRPRDVNPSLSDAIEAVVLRCLAKDPADRYANAGDLKVALQAARAGSGVNTQMDASRASGPDLGGVTGRVQTAHPTTFQAPEGGPPVYVPTLMGVSQTPRIQVLEQSGRSVQVVNLTGDGLTVGRLPENNIALDDDAVSRFHLRLDWDGYRVMITDLGSSNGTMLAGHRLLPHVGQTWNAGDWLRVGPFWLRLDLPGSASASQRTSDTAFASHGSAAPTPQFVQQTPVSDPGRLQVMLDQQEMTLTPGQPAVLRATLANLGKIVDHLRITVEGVPESWVHLPPDEIQLNPGAQYPLALQVNVPRAPQSYAGEYPITVRARSRENPTESGTAEALWRVESFAESSMKLTPNRAGGRLRASFRIAMENSGNSTERFRLKGEDDEQVLQYRFARDVVELGPDEKATVPLSIGVARRWVGSAQTKNFMIQSIPSSGRAQTVNGQVVHKAMFPPWMIPVATAIVLALAVLAFQLLKPVIETLTLNDRVLAEGQSHSVTAGQAFVLSWNVKRPHTPKFEGFSGIIADLPGNGQIVCDGTSLSNQTTCIGMIDQPGTYRVQLIADGWFANSERAIEIVVEPTAEDPPSITSFVVNDQDELFQVTQGEIVEFRWAVVDAKGIEIIFLNTPIHESSDPTGRFPFALTDGGKSGVYTLKAWNTGGAVERTVEIIVEPPPTPTPTSTEGPDPSPGETPTMPHDDGTDDGQPTPTPTPTPMPPDVAKLDPVTPPIIPEGMCIIFEWDIQNASAIELWDKTNNERLEVNDNPSIPAQGEYLACPGVGNTDYEWRLTGQDGAPHPSVTRRVSVTNLQFNGNKTKADFVGNWRNNDPESSAFGLTFVSVAESAPNELSFVAWVRTLPPDQAEPAGWGIELEPEAVVEVDLNTAPKLMVPFEEPNDFRLTLAIQGEDLVVRFFNHRMPNELDEFVLQRVPPLGPLFPFTWERFPTELDQWELREPIFVMP
jgi:serine/threonine protein kinase